MKSTVIYRGHAFPIADGQVFDPAVADQYISARWTVGTGRNEPHASVTLDGHQSRAVETASYPGRGEDQLIYPTVALAEEAGELAGAVRKLLHKQRGETEARREHQIADAALALAEANGLVMGLVKKAYRNEPAGELTTERVAAVRRALGEANHAVMQMIVAVQSSDRVEFPPLPFAVGDLEHLVHEAGDALWYVSCFCTEARVSLGYVADNNYDRLTDRARRGVIKSTGDNR